MSNASATRGGGADRQGRMVDEVGNQVIFIDYRNTLNRFPVSFRRAVYLPRLHLRAVC